MSSLVSLMGIGLLACIFSYYSIHAGSQSVPGGATIQLNVSVGQSAIANIDDDFVCATLDWWPPEKCDFGTCSWHRTSLLNLVFPSGFTMLGEFHSDKNQTGYGSECTYTAVH